MSNCLSLGRFNMVLGKCLSGYFIFRQSFKNGGVIASASDAESDEFNRQGSSRPLLCNQRKATLTASNSRSCCGCRGRNNPAARFLPPLRGFGAIVCQLIFRSAFIRGKNIVSKTRPAVKIRDGLTTLSRRCQASRLRTSRRAY
jgi:hypothetical protein